MYQTIARFLAAAVIVACAGTTAFAADKVTFQLDWIPGGDKSPIYICIHFDICAKHDLEIDIASGRGSSDAITKMATGTSEVGVAGLSALMTAKAREGAPVKAVMAYFTKGPHAFYTTTGTGITKLSDVAGKKVATAPFSSSNVFLPLVLDANGIDPASVTIINAEPGALGPLLMTGQVDAVISWVTSFSLYTAQSKEAGKEIVVLPWSEGGLTLYSATLMASDKFLTERPEVARRFVKAYQESVAFMIGNPEGAAEALVAMVPELDLKVSTGSAKDALPLIDNEVTDKDGLGVIEPGRLKSTWMWVSKSQKLPEDALDPESVVDRSFLN